MWLVPTQGSEFVYYADFTLKSGKFIQEIVQAFYLCDGKLFFGSGNYRFSEIKKHDEIKFLVKMNN